MSFVLCRGPPFSAGARPPSRDENDESNLYIGYLPNNISEEELQRLFEPFGRIEETKVIKDRGTGLSKGFGFVKFSDAREAKEVGCDTSGSEAALVSWLLRGLIRNLCAIVNQVLSNFGVQIF
jgi:hypothetical protein